MLQRVVATGRGEVHSRDIRIARVDFVRARQPPLLIDRLPSDHIQQPFLRKCRKTLDSRQYLELSHDQYYAVRRRLSDRF